MKPKILTHLQPQMPRGVHSLEFLEFRDKGSSAGGIGLTWNAAVGRATLTMPAFAGIRTVVTVARACDGYWH